MRTTGARTGSQSWALGETSYPLQAAPPKAELPPDALEFAAKRPAQIVVKRVIKKQRKEAHLGHAGARAAAASEEPPELAPEDLPPPAEPIWEAPAPLPPTESSAAAGAPEGERGRDGAPPNVPILRRPSAVKAAAKPRGKTAAAARQGHRVQVPPDVQLGCSKCAYCEIGCTRCRPRAGLVQSPDDKYLWQWPTS